MVRGRLRHDSRREMRDPGCPRPLERASPLRIADRIETRRHHHVERCVAPFPPGLLTPPCEHLAGLFERERERRPAVAQLEGAPQRTAGAAAHPDRHVGARRVRLDDEPADVVVRAVVLRVAPAPRGADGADGVVGPLAPASKVAPSISNSSRSVPTPTPSTSRPSLTRSSWPYRFANASGWWYARTSTQVTNRIVDVRGGEEAEGRERVPVRGAAAADLGVGHPHVLGTGAEVESEPIGFAHDLRDILDRAFGEPRRAVLGARQDRGGETEDHGRHGAPSGWTRWTRARRSTFPDGLRGSSSVKCQTRRTL